MHLNISHLSCFSRREASQNDPMRNQGGKVNATQGSQSRNAFLLKFLNFLAFFS